MSLHAELREPLDQEFEVPKSRIEGHATIGDKGRLVIPLAIREALGFEAGDEVDMYIENHELHLSTRWNRIARAQERARIFFGTNRSLAEELINERRAEVLAEDSAG
jgi:AbrB family looped-hinge helix DNA binding protein